MFLYELDRPNSEQTSRPPPRPTGLRLVPMAVEGGGGALVLGAF